MLVAIRATDGAVLWQDLAPRVKRGMGEFLLPSTTSAPCVEGNRLYYVTAECQLRCLDTQIGQQSSGNWDMCGRLGVFPHEASNSEVLPIGDLLIVWHVQRPQRRPHARSLAVGAEPDRSG